MFVLFIKTNWFAWLFKQVLKKVKKEKIQKSVVKVLQSCNTSLKFQKGTSNRKFLMLSSYFVN